MNGQFTGVWAMVRHILRRDRLRLAIWIGALSVLAAVTASSIKGLYPTSAALAQAASIIATNTAVIAMSGPPRALDTLGGRVAFEVWQYCIAIALMAVLTVGRHTRGEEESGRAELLRATVLGRHAQSLAALLVASAASVIIGGLMAVSLVTQDLPVAGSVALGAGFASIGVVFAAIALVANQLTEHARAASGVAGAVLGATYLLRAVGDTGSAWVSWLSPFGWAQALRPFAGERWWPLLVVAVGTLAGAAGAMALERRRDHGAGLVAPRPGPPVAPPALGRPFGVAWRLQRGAIAAWGVGIGLGGLVFGTLADDAEKLLEDNQTLRDYLTAIGGASLVDIFLATLLSYLVLCAAGFAAQSVAQLHSEEVAGRAAIVLATHVSRRRWIWSSLAVTAIGAVVLAVVAGLSLGVSAAWALRDAGQITRLFVAGVAAVLAVALVAAVAVLAFGVSGRWAFVAWGYLAFCVVDLMFGTVLRFPGWVRNLSPFHHLGTMPASTPSLAVFAALVAVVAVGVVGGVLGFARRDVN